MRPPRFLAAPVALNLLLVACGDDGDTSGAAEQVLRFEVVSVGAADEGIDGVEAFRIESTDHASADVEYSVTPPPGGPHGHVWASCGFHDEPLREEEAVHDLEHGAVWLAFSPDLPEADVQVLRDIVDANPKTIAAPYDGLAAGEAVVATAWARQLRLDRVDDLRLAAFVGHYQGSSQAPEADVTCE